MAQAKKKSVIKVNLEFAIPVKPDDLASVQKASGQVEAFKRSITEQGYDLLNVKAKLAEIIVEPAPSTAPTSGDAPAS